MNKTDYPLVLATSIHNVLRDFRKLVLVNSHLVELDNFEYPPNEERVISLKGIGLNSKFYFSIYKPLLSDNEPIYEIQRCPKNELTNEAFTATVSYRKLDTHFNQWISILNNFTQIEFSQTDEFERQYQQEFYAEFEIVDADAESSPFEHERQIYIYRLLEYIEEALIRSQPSDDTLGGIITEIQQLQLDIPKTTKKNIILGLSKIFAKVKMHGIKLFMDVMDVAKKEAIKRLLYAGYDELNQIMSIIKSGS